MKKWVGQLGILAMALLVFSGCASGGPSTSGANSNTEDAPLSVAAPAPSNTAQPKSTEVQTLKLGMAGTDIKTACIIIADALGYYAEEGVNVEFEKISNLADGIAAVDMGKLDVLPFGVIPSATYVGQGADVVVFGGTISEGSEIVTLPENAAGIRTLEDFRGKKVGCYRMETGHMVVKGLLREAGFNLEKNVEFVLLDSQATIIEAVKKGEVDMGFLNSGQGYVAQQAGLSVAKRVAEFESDFPCCRQTTSRACLTEKRDALVRFQIANLRAYEVFTRDHDTSIKVLAAYCGQPPEYVQAVMYGLPGEYESAMAVSLDPNKAKVEAFYETMKANGDIDPATEYKMGDHIDISIYADALAEMQRRNPDSELFNQLATAFEANNN